MYNWSKNKKLYYDTNTWSLKQIELYKNVTVYISTFKILYLLKKEFKRLKGYLFNLLYIKPQPIVNVDSSAGTIGKPVFCSGNVFPGSSGSVGLE